MSVDTILRFRVTFEIYKKITMNVLKNLLFYFVVCLLSGVSLMGQVTNQVDLNSEMGLERKSKYNLDELKIRWKKAAMENCTGVPCNDFICGNSTVSDIDGNAYTTVLIGKQCWTKENLKVTKYNNNDVIPDSTLSTWGMTATGARTEYVVGGVTVSGYVGTYGYIYNWYAVDDQRKLCPAGWHVPLDGEWSTMIQHLDNAALSTTVGTQSPSAGGSMKSLSSLWNAPNTRATNSSGFSALPAAFRNSSGVSGGIRINAFFWSSSSIDAINAWYRNVGTNNSNVDRLNLAKSHGASVRCIKD